MSMRPIEQLQEVEFPGVDPVRFAEWRQEAASAARNTKTTFVILLIFNLILVFTVGAIALGGLPLFFVLYLLNRRSRRLLRELGITAQEINNARRLPLSEVIKSERKCPRCAELIKAEAPMCRFCGHTFDSAEAQQQTALQSQQIEAERAVRAARVGQAKIRSRLTVLQWFYYITAALNVFLALVCFAGFMTETNARDKTLAFVLLTISLTFMVHFRRGGLEPGKEKEVGAKTGHRAGRDIVAGFSLGHRAGHLHPNRTQLAGGEGVASKLNLCFLGRTSMSSRFMERTGDEQAQRSETMRTLSLAAILLLVAIQAAVAGQSGKSESSAISATITDFEGVAVQISGLQFRYTVKGTKEAVIHPNQPLVLREGGDLLYRGRRQESQTGLADPLHRNLGTAKRRLLARHPGF